MLLPHISFLFYVSRRLYRMFCSIFSSRFLSRVVTGILILLKRDANTIRTVITNNCRQMYLRRLQGRTWLNPARNYGCRYCLHLTKITPFRHILILDLDETLVYSCKFSDISPMMRVFDSIGVTIVIDRFDYEHRCARTTM